MQAALAQPVDYGRAPKPLGQKGGTARALPLLIITLLIVSGLGLSAKALYIPVKAVAAQILLDRAFEQSLAASTPVRPWSWADTAPVARVSVGRLSVSEVVLSGGSGEALAFGPTAVLNDPSRRVTVLAAHRDTHFEFVQDLKFGDTITLERIDGGISHYSVRGFETVNWDAFTVPEDGGDGLLALTTCYPFDTDTPGPLRRVAWAERTR